MGLNNICMIMAPNLFLAPAPKGDKSKMESHLELTKAANTSNIIKMLIHYQNVLWMVSLFQDFIFKDSWAFGEGINPFIYKRALVLSNIGLFFLFFTVLWHKNYD